MSAVLIRGRVGSSSASLNDRKADPVVRDNVVKALIDMLQGLGWGEARVDSHCTSLTVGTG